MHEDKETKVEIDGASINVTKSDGKQVNVSPGGVHVKSNDSEVKVSWSGISMFWRPLVGCGITSLVFAALLTVIVAVIIKLIFGNPS